MAARLTEQLGATVTITAYIATGSDDAAAAHDLSSLRRTYSGGARIPPPVVEDVAVRTGMVIRPVYGLTETTGPTHLALHEHETPGPCRDGSAIGRADCPGHPDPDPRLRRSGTAPARSARWSCADRRSCPDTGSAPDETGAAIVDGELRTGDVGVVDEDGWLYLVDRRMT